MNESRKKTKKKKQSRFNQMYNCLYHPNEQAVRQFIQKLGYIIGVRYNSTFLAQMFPSQPNNTTTIFVILMHKHKIRPSLQLTSKYPCNTKSSINNLSIVCYVNNDLLLAKFHSRGGHGLMWYAQSSYAFLLRTLYCT